LVISRASMGINSARLPVTDMSLESIAKFRSISEGFGLHPQETSFMRSFMTFTVLHSTDVDLPAIIRPNCSSRRSSYG
jgi:hypothetical protein